MNEEGRIAVGTAELWPEGAEEEGVVLDWMVSEGKQVEEGDPLCVFQAEKVDVEVPAPASGTIDEIVVEEDITFERGDTLAYIVPE